MASNFHNWIQRISPIPATLLFEIQVPNSVESFISSSETFISECPILIYVRISEDHLFQPTNDVSADLCMDDLLSYKDEILPCFESLFPPTSIDFQLTINFPSLVNDLFVKLCSSRLEGRTYADNAKVTDVQPSLPLRIQSYDRSICRHGLRRYECGLCEEEAEKRNKKLENGSKVKPIDLFQLLLPVLMPPLDKFITDQTLFPENAKPYPYQFEGIKFLRDRTSALLGDEMGLGKTIQTIVAIRLLLQKGIIKNALVVCPLSLIGNWNKEIERWAPELVSIKVRGNRDIRKMYWKNPFNIYITTYETLREDIDNSFVTPSHFSLVVLDEIQKIKNPDTKIFKALHKLQPKYRWGLSGTPLENRLEDVLSIFAFLKPDLMFPYPIESSRVKKTIKPYFLRRRICDVELELPEKINQEYWLDLTPNQQIAYDRVYAEAKADIQGQDRIDRIHVFSWLNKLKLICNEEEQSEESCKKDFLIEQLEYIRKDEKVIVFSQFPEKTLRKLLSTLDPYAPALYSGKDSSEKRDEILDHFMGDGPPRILLASLKAGGVGINLQRANRVFHFDHWWNPAVTKQAEGRAHRTGQKRIVFVYDLFTNGTIEEKIYQILVSKQDLFNTVIDDLSNSAPATQITDEELYGLFDLKPPTSKKTPEEIKNKIGKLDPSGFENLIGKLFSRKGYEVKVVGGASDGGVDVRARGTTRAGLENIYIQCKHYFDRQVGPGVIREAIGTKQIGTVDRMFIITSGTFSDEAIMLANRHNIKLMNISELIGELITNKIDI